MFAGAIYDSGGAMFASYTQAALKTPQVRDGLARLGAVPAGGSPAQFKQMIDRETARWSEVIETAKIEKLD